MLTQEQRQKIEQLAQAEDIRFMVLHGSRTDDTAHAESDFDIAILLRAGTITESFGRYGHLLETISDIMGVSGDKIDFTDLRQAPLLLKYEVVRKGVLLFGDEYDYELFKLDSIRDYHDADDLRNLERIIIAKRQVLLTQ